MTFTFISLSLSTLKEANIREEIKRTILKYFEINKENKCIKKLWEASKVAFKRKFIDVLDLFL